MKARDIITVKVWDKNAGTYGDWQDITDGVLSINTVTGNDSFQGFWEQADTGQFTIVARGSTADPNINELIKTNGFIYISGTFDQAYNANTVFLGFITDVNVDYSKGQKQVITINGTDLIGYLNRLVITQDYIDTNITPIYSNNVAPVSVLIEDATYTLSEDISNFFNLKYASGEFGFLGSGDDLILSDTVPPAPLVKIEPGKTIYELIQQGISSALITYRQIDTQTYIFIPYPKYDYGYYKTNLAEHQYISQIMANFKTNKADAWQAGYPNEEWDCTFKSIRMNNGFNKIINQVSVSNTNPITDETISIDPLVDEQSTFDYGPAKLNGQTTFTTTQNSFLLPTSTIEGQAAEYQNAVLQYQSSPKSNIEAITIDYIQSHKINSSIDYIQIGSQINIQHKIDDDNYIYGTYTVCGIKHWITESDWMTEFVVRDSDLDFIVSNQPKVPVIQMNSLSGGTGTSFTASISNYTTEELNALAKIEWMVNLPQFYRPTLPPSRLGYNGIHLFNGNTATWTYSDFGILKEYPEQLRGPGVYNVAVWLTNTEGYTVIGLLTDLLNNENQLVQVIGTQAHADFIYSINTDGGVVLTDSSAADTLTWDWNFGDGTTYSGQTPPNKYYTNAGTYTITLTVTNGETNHTKTQNVTVSYRPLAVKYVRLRYQGTATKAAGSSTWSSNFIDTIGLVELKNTSLQQTGGIQPMYINARTIDKVQDIAKSNKFAWDRVLDYYYEGTTYLYGYTRRWLQCSLPLSPTDPYFPYTPYSPYFTTDYTNTGPLYPMSQTCKLRYDDPISRGTTMGYLPKYKFFPVITTNPDGSQTKTLDIDIIIDYSKTYTYGTSDSNSTSVYRNWYNGQPAGKNVGSTYLPPSSISYLPSAKPTSVQNWNEWENGSTSDYGQKYKLKEVKLWPGQLLSVPGTNSYTEIRSMQWPHDIVDRVLNPASDILDTYGLTNGTYLPISISVSEDGITYRKIGEATFTGNTASLTTTYSVPMPPYSNAPIEA